MLKLSIQNTKIKASGAITLWQIKREKVEPVTDYILGAQKSLWMVTTTMQLKDSCSLGENCDKPRQHTKKQRHHLNDRSAYSHRFGLSSSCVQL